MWDMSFVRSVYMWWYWYILHVGFGFYVDGDGNMIKKPQVGCMSILL